MPPTPSSAKRRPELVLEVAGERLSLQPCGGLWWQAAGVLVVSDLHLEKASSYAARGQMLPPYDTGATLRRVLRLVEQFAPTTVIALGDSFHDRGARMRMAPRDVTLVRGLTEAVDWVWIEGNHDPQPPADLGGRTARELRLGALVFRHEPMAGPAQGEIAGHLHPCARVAGRAGRSVRARCFVTDGARLVMPSYGALTGGLNLLDEAFAAFFPDGAFAAVAGRDGVYLAGGERLLADGLRAAG